MWYVDDIIELTELALISRYVEQDTDDPAMVNVIFVGSAGKGKSRIIKVFSKFPKLKLVTNTSYDQIASKIMPEIDKGEVLTLAFPEFNKILQRKESTMLSTIATLNSLVEEGYDCVEMPHQNVKYDPALKVNEILAITTDVYDKYFQNFWEIGFAQRHIHETWSYTQAQIDDICERIHRNEHLETKLINHNCKVTPIKMDSMFSRALTPLATTMTKSLMDMAKKIYEGKGIPNYHRKDSEVIPFRYLKQLRLLCQASALERGNREVDIEDYKRIKRLSTHMNFDFNVLDNQE